MQPLHLLLKSSWLLEKLQCVQNVFNFCKQQMKTVKKKKNPKSMCGSCRLCEGVIGIGKVAATWRICNLGLPTSTYWNKKTAHEGLRLAATHSSQAAAEPPWVSSGKHLPAGPPQFSLNHRLGGTERMMWERRPAVHKSSAMLGKNLMFMWNTVSTCKTGNTS